MASDPHQKQRPLLLGPRGLKGVLGWTFFDPANLIAIPVILGAAFVVVIAMLGRGDSDWGMPIGLYVCFLAFLRGYFFSYYHGRLHSRLVTLVVLVFGLGAAGLLWEDNVAAFEVLRASGPVMVTEAKGFHVAAILHLLAIIVLVAHIMLPRRWLISTTEDWAHKAHVTAEDDDSPPHQ